MSEACESRWPAVFHLSRTRLQLLHGPEDQRLKPDQEDGQGPAEHRGAGGVLQVRRGEEQQGRQGSLRVLQLQAAENEESEEGDSVHAHAGEYGCEDGMPEETEEPAGDHDKSAGIVRPQEEEG